MTTTLWPTETLLFMLQVPGGLLVLPLPKEYISVPKVGADVGVTWLDEPDGEPVPMALVAVTVHVKAVPLVSAVTVIWLATPWPVRPPPFEAGGVKLTVDCAFPEVAVPSVGGPVPVDAGVTWLDEPDGEPVPMA